MRAKQLSKQDWIDCAVTALLHGGRQAVAVEPLATTLGTTKGSFYWHFGSRAELLDATLTRWRETATSNIIALVERHGGSAEDRLRYLLTVVTARAEIHPGELGLLTDPDPHVKAVVAESVIERIDYLIKLLAATGLSKAEAKSRAVLAYAAYVGYAQLAAGVPQALPQRARQRASLMRSMADLLVQPVTTVLGQHG